MPRFARSALRGPPRCRRSYRDPVRCPRRRPSRPRREHHRPPRPARRRHARLGAVLASDRRRRLAAAGGWSPATPREFYDQVIALAKGLVAAGIEPGDKIGLMCKTRYEWTLIYFPTWFAGGGWWPI